MKTTTQKAAEMLRYSGFKATAPMNANLIIVKNISDSDLMEANRLLSSIFKNFDAIIISSK